MITNNSLTIYHYDVDENHNDRWVKFNYEKVWFFGGQGASTNKGYDNANDVQIRIPYGQNANLDFSNFSIGDIAVAGTLDQDITDQHDLDDYQIYNITSKNDNNFGSEPHVHLSGK